jgi:phosphoenolpyruvate carboxykinase (ATP)
MELVYTRALLRAVLTGGLSDVPFTPGPVFGLDVPIHCPEVPDHVLRPRETWSDTAAYDRQAQRLAGLFQAESRKYRI